MLNAASASVQRKTYPLENSRAVSSGESFLLASGSSEDSPKWLAMAVVTIVPGSSILCFRTCVGRHIGTDVGAQSNHLSPHQRLVGLDRAGPDMIGNQHKKQVWTENPGRLLSPRALASRNRNRMNPMGTDGEHMYMPWVTWQGGPKRRTTLPPPSTLGTFS